MPMQHFGYKVTPYRRQVQLLYIALEESDEYRMSVDGKFAVWRSKDAGDS